VTDRRSDRQSVRQNLS